MEPKRTTKKRDNNLHQSLFQHKEFPDGTNVGYYSKGKKILEGYKQGNKIVCSHCDSEVSPSQFEAHAGWAARRQPYRHIYTSSGQTLHELALMLANGQNVVTSNNANICAVCGIGGELFVCEGCATAFHAVCLRLQSVPTGDLHCSHCGDKFTPGRKESKRKAGDSSSIRLRLDRSVKQSEFEDSTCVVCRSSDFNPNTFDERTILLCDQCDKEYHVGCLRYTSFCDLKELPKGNWFCCSDCNSIHDGLQNLVLKGAELVPPSVLNAVVQKHTQRGLVDGILDDIAWRILNGESQYKEHQVLLSRAEAIFRERFDPIIAESDHDLIHDMVNGRNKHGWNFRGMLCAVLTVKSVVVSVGLLRVCNREVAELPLVATSRENEGKGYFEALFSCIEKLLSTMNVENLVVPAAKEVQPFWTKKLGFQKMSDERLLSLTEDLQVMVFKGTSMLEKKVAACA